MIKIIILALSLFAAYVNAKVLHVDNTGFIIQNEIETPHSSKKVWYALINDVDEWWPKDHSWWKGTFTISSSAGGCFCEKKGKQQAQHMQITFVDPMKMLRMAGGLGPLQGMGVYGALNWKFEKTESGTKVTLSYYAQGYRPDGFEDLAPIVAKVQNQQLNALKAFVEKNSEK
ncbi:SRPBCC domain-containing protein [Alteromonas sp. ASW11-130]|uniref:SRPBCC domain-containing protein n=1 Tax=Alteromonas sp. ASW11-130 TaxID=3015775 RepID=UPI002241BE50|nr:SRPBCC domain-containing protein [Alteromonas sp. ASW11-130]MCW8092106.1 SRPBCC domain-containing protein [Alteromonas sp. ASW11-130]